VSVAEKAAQRGKVLKENEINESGQHNQKAERKSDLIDGLVDPTSSSPSRDGMDESVVFIERMGSKKEVKIT